MDIRLKRWTFMKALESSSVHCEKSRLSEKRCKPGNAGTKETLSNSLGWAFGKVYFTHRRSISCIYGKEPASPCSSTRYSSTQVTRWSLKVPLISWCKISGVRRVWMSARGKLWVKDYCDSYQRNNEMKSWNATHNNIISEAIVIPDNTRIKATDEKLPLGTETWQGFWIV